MTFVPQMVASIAGFLGSTAGVSAGLGLAGLAMQGQAMRDAKQAAKPPKPTRLPTEDDEAVRMRMAAARAKGRTGYRETLATGQLGDSRPPAVSAPLALGRV